MAVERHRIGRQVLEITTGREADARRLQRRLGPLQRSRLERLIDRCCTEAGRAGVLYRIDSLELDLGRVDLRNLSEELPLRLEAGLKAAIADEVREQDARTRRGGLEPEMAARLELLEVFARTGTLPWWADTSRADVVDHALRRLARGGRPSTRMAGAARWADSGDAVPGLRRWIRRVIRAPERLARLIRHTTDDTLMSLLGILRPGGAVETARVASFLRRAGSLAGAAPARSRVSAWTGLLASADEAATSARPVDRWRDTLARTALDLGLGLTDVIAELRGRSGPAPRPRPGAPADPLAPILDDLAGELPGGDPDPPRSEGALSLTRLAQAPGPLRPLFAELRAVVSGILGGAPQAWAGPLRDLNAAAEGVGHGIAQPLRKLLVQLAAEERMPRALLDRYPLRRLRAASPAELAHVAEDVAHGVRRTASRSKPPEERPEAADLEHPDSDVAYVDNAGLVLLGPFLPRFLERLDLVADDRFVEVAAQKRGAMLLQHLVTESPAPPEYQLALNKILCGLEVTEPVDVDEAPTPEETEECRVLLESVIEHAGLGEMSIEGFRGTFLLRNGVISARGRAWALHVERATYDVVLDRLPWSTSWVRHPWMIAPLEVEW